MMKPDTKHYKYDNLARAAWSSCTMLISTFSILKTPSIILRKMQSHFSWLLVVRPTSSQQSMSVAMYV